MVHRPIQNIDPFDFGGLQIRELTPAGLDSVSVAEIEVAPGAHHPRARSTKCDKIYICAQRTVSFWIAGWITGRIAGQVAEPTIELANRGLLLIDCKIAACCSSRKTGGSSTATTAVEWPGSPWGRSRPSTGKAKSFWPGIRVLNTLYPKPLYWHNNRPTQVSSPTGATR